MITVWFDAWRFQHEKAPIIALLHEIRRQYEAWDKVTNSGKKLTEVAIRTVLNSFSDIAKLLSFEAVPVKSQGIQQTGEKWEKDHLENKLGVDTIQAFLEKAIDTLLKPKRGKPKKRLVIIIDDLDRCSPTAAYRLLEGLKVYLSLKNCVFVIGMNQQIVIEAIAEKLSEGQRLENLSHSISAPSIRAEAYLEKMCSSIERLHPPSDCNDLLKRWITDSHLKDNLIDALKRDEDDFIQCLPPNPRRLKALANVLNRWQAFLPPNEDDQAKNVRDVQALLIIAYVYQFHGELFQRWHFTPSFYSHMKKWATGSSVGREAVNANSWPTYFTILELPEEITSSYQGGPVPKTVALSNYSDPYSANVFWVAPLINYADLAEQDINPILKAVTSN